MAEARARTAVPREGPGFPWLLVVFFLLFAGILLIASQRRVDVPRRPAPLPGRERGGDRGKGAPLDPALAAERSSGVTERARLVASGQVLDDLRARPVRGVRVVLTLRLPLGGSAHGKGAHDPRAAEILEALRVQAPPGPRETSKDGLELPVLGAAETGDDGSFAIPIECPPSRLSALVWALRRSENRFDVTVRCERDGKRLQGHRSVEADRWTENGSLDAGAVVVREAPGHLAVQVSCQGDPVEGALVTLADHPGDSERGVTLPTDARGQADLYPELAKATAIVRKAGFATEVREIDLASSEAREVFPLVPDAPLRGRATDSRSRPVAGALVVARELDSVPPERRAFASFAWTDQGGVFRLAGLRPARRYVLTAFPGASDDLVPGTAEVSAPSDDARLVLSHPGKLGVTVTFPEGSRPSCLTLEALRQGEEGTWTCAVRESEVARTAQGRVLFSRLEPGAYRVRYSPYACDGNDGDCVEAVSPQVTVPEDGEAPPLALELTRARTISGRVLDTRGAPIAGAKVGPECCLHSSRTGEDGRFELREVAQRDVWIVATAPGFEETRRLVLAAEDALSPDIALVAAPPPVPRPK